MLKCLRENVWGGCMLYLLLRMWIIIVKSVFHEASIYVFFFKIWIFKTMMIPMTIELY